MSDCFRFAVIGAGKIAHKFCDAARRAGAQVASVASKSEERAADFAKQENIPAFFGSYETMLDTVRPDAVYIATTHNFHYENILLCLSKKIPVLCEKPMVCTRKEAEIIFAEAQKQNTFVMEGMWARFLPQVVQAKKWLEEGRIGHVELATSTVAFRAEYDPESRLFNPALAGGAVWDVGVYALELITFLMGEQPLEVQPMITRTPSGVDRAASINLRFSDSLACAQTTCMASTRNGSPSTERKVLFGFPMPCTTKKPCFITVRANWPNILSPILKTALFGKWRKPFAVCARVNSKARLSRGAIPSPVPEFLIPF